MASRSTNVEATTYTTGHASLACWLWFRNHEILEIKWTDDLCKWTFVGSEAMHQDKEQFFSDEARVHPRDYWPKVSEFWREMKKAKPQS